MNAFDAFRKKRNSAGYDQAGVVSDAEGKSKVTNRSRAQPAAARTRSGGWDLIVAATPVDG